MLGRVRLPVLLSYVAFVLVGVNAGTNGVLLLAQMGDYGVGRATIGLTFFTGAAGFVLGGLTTGWLIHRFGTRLTLVVGGGTFVLASLYLATRPPFVALVLVQLGTGYGAGILESGLNAYLAELPGATTLLNRLHAFFGVGALAGPVLAAWITGFTSWTVVSLVLALAFAPVTAGFLAAHPARAPDGLTGAGLAGAGLGGAGLADTGLADTGLADAGLAGAGLAGAGFADTGPANTGPANTGPADTGPAKAGAGTPGRAGGSLLGTALRDPGVLLGAVMLAVYVGLEIGVGNWGFSYLVQDRGLSGQAAGYGVSGYWLGLTLGRFLISPVCARIGATPIRMIYGCLACIVAATALAWAAPTAVAAGAALVVLGFFLGPIFPTTMAVVPGLVPARLSATAIGVMNAGSTVGGAGLPWLAGTISQSTGIWVLLPFTLVLAAMQFAVWRPLASRVRLPGATGGQGPVPDVAGG